MNVLLIETDSRDAQNISSFLRDRGHLCLLTDSAKSAKNLLKKEAPGLVLLHLNGNSAHALDFLETAQNLDPPVPVIVLTRKPRLDDAVSAVKKGAYDFWTKPVETERLTKTIEILEQRDKETNPPVQTDLADPIISLDPVLCSVKALARKIAPSNATVFIQGESGTGKELFARYIHNHSGRKDKPFVALNCAALPETLLESELFGFEKGAFTGAIRSREGKFELAHTGTLLLDEVTEIPIHLQAKLLRVLQEGEVDRLGGSHPVPVDVRVIATTNVRVEEMVREGKFRKDLYYRLNVIPLKIPPLNERPRDIMRLAEHFLERYSAENGSKVHAFAPDALKKLSDYCWPGNVRELQNVVQRAVLISDTPAISRECVILDPSLEQDGPEPATELSLMPLCQVEKMMIEKALGTVDGNRTRAAELLGISVRTLRNKLAEYRQSIGM